MNRKQQTIIEIAAAAVFAVSALVTALRTQIGWAPLASNPLSFDRSFAGGMALRSGSGQVSLLGIVAQPTSLILWALLAAMLAAVALYARARSRLPGAAPQPPAITLGLVLAALWPWVIGPAPLSGLVLGIGACVALAVGLARLGGAATTDNATGDVPPPAPGALALAFVLGWLVMAAANALGMVVFDLGVGLERAILLGLLVSALAGAWLQLRLPRLVTFSAAVIWAMIGIAAVAAGSSITIATACVLGMSALAVILVRTAT